MPICTRHCAVQRRQSSLEVARLRPVRSRKKGARRGRHRCMVVGTWLVGGNARTPEIARSRDALPALPRGFAGRAARSAALPCRRRQPGTRRTRRLCPPLPRKAGPGAVGPDDRGGADPAGGARHRCAAVAATQDQGKPAAAELHQDQGASSVHLAVGGPFRAARGVGRAAVVAGDGQDLRAGRASRAVGAYDQPGDRRQQGSGRGPYHPGDRGCIACLLPYRQLPPRTRRRQRSTPMPRR